MPTGWELLEAGEFVSALQEFRREYDEDPDSATLGNIGLTYLSMGDFRSAKATFDSMIEESPEHSSDDYAGAGVARWLLGEHNGAVETWNAGLGCDYAAAGGMDIPLLLYFGAVKMRSEPSPEDVTKLIRKRLEHPFARNWPGPIGQFVVGDMNESVLRSQAVARHPILTARQSTQAEFYIGVRHLADADTAGYLECLRRSCTFNSFELEWYLARSEIEAVQASGLF